MVCVNLWKHDGINGNVAATRHPASMSETGSLQYKIPTKIALSLRTRNNLSIKTH